MYIYSFGVKLEILMLVTINLQFANVIPIDTMGG